METPTESAAAAPVVDDLVVTSSGDPAPDPTPEPVVSAQGDGDAGEETHHAEPVPDDAAASDAAKTLAKRKRTAQDRINDLARDKYRLEGELHALRSQQTRPATAADSTAPPPASASDAGMVRPKEEDFATYAEYVDAAADYRVYLALAADRQARTQQQAQAQQDQTVSTFLARTEAFKAAHPDYLEVVSNPDVLAVAHPYLHQAIAASDLGPAVAYYLGTHLDECRALASQPTAAQFDRAFGKLEARLEAASPSASAPNPKPVPPPPAPLTPIATGGSAATASPDDLPFGRDYIRAQNKADEARGRRY